MTYSMDTFFSLLSDRTRDRVIDALKTVQTSVDEDFILNVEFKQVKNTLNYAIEQATGNIFDTCRPPRDRQLTELEMELHYAQSYIHLVPALLKKVAKLRTENDSQYVIKSVAMLNELAPVAAQMDLLKTKIVKGRKPTGKVVEIDTTNMGTCAICGRLHKLTKAGKLVDHGFQISDGHGSYIGFRSGKCFGVGYAPYELSNEANKAFEPVVDSAIAYSTDKLHSLNRNEINTFITNVKRRKAGSSWERETVIVEVTKESEPEKHERIRQHRINETTNELAGLAATAEANRAKITNWVLKSL